MFIYNGYGTQVTNYGSIFGMRSGVYVQNSSPVSEGPRIDNHHLIHSGGNAIFIDAYSDEKTTIINREGAKIVGDGGVAINVRDGAIAVKNMGLIKGLIQSDMFADGDDKVVNEGKIKGNVSLWGVRQGKGRGWPRRDVYKNKGGKAEMVSSDYGNDTLVAGDSRDKFLFASGLDSSRTSIG